MSEPPLHSSDAPARRRSRDRERRRRRLRLGSALAVVACAMVAVGALDGGSTTKPSGALAHGRPLHAPGGPAPRMPAVRLPLRERLLRQEIRTVDAILRRNAYVSVAGRHRREMALTFDDGPGPYTLGVVRVLRHLDVPATFFQVGFSEHWFTDAERAEVRDPHVVIGDHTENHPDLDRLSAAAQRAQIDEQAAVVRAAGAPTPRLFRPPYGEFDATTLALLRHRHMLMILWTVDSQDYRRPGIAAIVRRVLSGARPGAIVLMHDAGGIRTQTIAALPRIVRALRRRHFRLVTVPRLLHDDPPSVHQPRISGAG